MKQLIEKRNALMTEFDGLKAKREAEKRAAYSNEEMERVNAISIEIADIDKQIKAEKAIEEQRNFKLDSMVGTGVKLSTDSNDIVERTNIELVNFLTGKEFSDEFRSSNGKFILTNDYLKERQL